MKINQHLGETDVMSYLTEDNFEMVNSLLREIGMEEKELVNIGGGEDQCFVMFPENYHHVERSY